MIHPEIVAEWREQVCAPAARSSRLTFALCVAFAAPLCRLLGRRAHAYHLHGDASAGHAAGLYLASAVYGGAGELRSWPEFARDPLGVADEERDGPLLLDAFDEVDAAARNAAGRAVWGDSRRTTPVALSAGIGASDGAFDSLGLSQSLIDIPADAGCGLGVFEHDIGGGRPDACAGMIAHNALCLEGVIGTVWLGVLNDAIRDLDCADRSTLLDSLGFSQSNSTRYFEMPALAGEIATAKGLTGWAEGDAREAVYRCARAWAATHCPTAALLTWGGLATTPQNQSFTVE